MVIPEEDEIILHGARSLKDLSELWPEPVAKVFFLVRKRFFFFFLLASQANGWKCVKSYPMKTFEEIERACRLLNPHLNEGD